MLHCDPPPPPQAPPKATRAGRLHCLSLRKPRPTGVLRGRLTPRDPSLPPGPSISTPPRRGPAERPTPTTPACAPRGEALLQPAGSEHAQWTSGLRGSGPSAQAYPSPGRLASCHAPLPGVKGRGGGPSDAPGSAVRTSRGAGQRSHGSSRPDRRARCGRP